MSLILIKKLIYCDILYNNTKIMDNIILLILVFIAIVLVAMWISSKGDDKAPFERDMTESEIADLNNIDLED